MHFTFYFMFYKTSCKFNKKVHCQSN